MPFKALGHETLMAITRRKWTTNEKQPIRHMHLLGGTGIYLPKPSVRLPLGIASPRWVLPLFLFWGYAILGRAPAFFSRCKLHVSSAQAFIKEGAVTNLAQEHSGSIFGSSFDCSSFFRLWSQTRIRLWICDCLYSWRIFEKISSCSRSLALPARHSWSVFLIIFSARVIFI